MKKSFTLAYCMMIILAAAVQAQELSFQHLAANVEQRLNSIFDLHAVIDLEIVQQGQVVITTFDLQSGKVQKLTRLEVLAPELAAGQIYLFDLENNQMSIYIPMAEQIILQPLAGAAGTFGLSLDFANMDQFLSLEDIKGEIEEVLTTEQGVTYKVKVTDLDQQALFLSSASTNPDLAVQYVWVDANFIPYRMEYYEGDVCLGKMLIREYELNAGITAEQLRTLPDVPVLQF